MLALFLCLVTAVHDGDTFTCKAQSGRSWKIRLEAIDAPEVDRCAPYKHCVSGDGQASARGLRRLILHRTVDCRRTGRSYQRITAWCATRDGEDLSCRMVRAGLAEHRWDRDQQLCANHPVSRQR